MILQKIKLKDFLSHKKTEIEFTSGQKILIDGKSGSGKSSIVDALVWVLFGKGRVDNRALIRTGQSSARVTVHLKGEKDYKIERSITQSGKHELKVMEDKRLVKTVGKKETQAYLEKSILHCTYLLFINSVVYPQENTENFVKQPANKRKDIILEMIKANDYDEHYDKAKKELKEREDLVGAIEPILEYINKNNKENLVIVSKLPKYILLHEEKVKDAEILLKKLEDRREEASNQREAKAAARVLREESLDAMSKKEKKETRRTELLARLIKHSPVTDGHRSELKKLKDNQDKYLEWQKESMKLMEEKPVDHNLEAKISDINAQLIEIMKEDLTECPELSKICPILERKHEDRIKVLESELTTAKTELSGYVTANKAHDIKLKMLGEAPELDSDKIKELENIIALGQDMDQFQKEINILTPEIEDIKGRIIEIGLEIDKLPINKGIVDLATLEESAEKQYNKMKEAGNDLWLKIQLAKKADSRLRNDMEEKEKRIEELKKAKEEMELLEVIKEAFSPKGIEAIVADYVLPQLEDRINNILDKLSDFRVRFDTQKSAVGDGTIEGLFINIINPQGEEFDFNSYSGGEKMRITASITEGLAEVLPIKFRVLDEAVVGLDEETVEKFVEVMLAIQSRFSQMICISHLPAIKDIFERVITVKKTNGISNVI